MAKKYPIPSGYMPLNYDQINNIEGHLQPSMLKYCNSITFAYWQRSLFQRAISTIDFTGLPEEWQANVRDFFYWCVFSYGYVGVFNTDEFGLSFQPGALYGFDFYYQPTEFIVANPKLNKRFKIHEDCELIKLCPDFIGIWDIISYYAMLLSALDSGINMSIVNNKFAYLLGAKNKAAAEVLKKLFDNVNKREPAVFFDKKLANDGTDKEEPWQALFRDSLKNNYIVTDLLQDFQTLINDFDTEVGIPTIPYFKKERMVTEEAGSKQIDATSRSIIWYDTLKDSFDRANEFLGFEEGDRLEVRLRYTPEEGGLRDGNGEDNTLRNV